MDMETDESVVIPPSATSTGTSLSTVFLWALLRKDGFKKDKLDLDLNSLTLKELKGAACKKLDLKSPDEIEVLYNGKKLTDEEALKSADIKPLTVVNVFIRNDSIEKSPVDLETASKNLTGQITQIALALRTAFFNPSFIPMIEKLGQNVMLENLLAISPGLKYDPVGIAIIQDPAMIFHLSDVESLKKLATTKPHVVEAFNFLAASVHQEKGSGPLSRVPPQIFNPTSIFEADDEDMDDDGDVDGASPSSRITREQLSAALNSLSALGRGALSSVGGPGPAIGGGSGNPGSQLLDFIAQATGQASSASSSVPQQATGGGSGPSLPGIPGLFPGSGGSNQALTPELVARAMAGALGRLPASQRTDQFNAIRNLASQIQQHNSPTANPAAATQEPVASSASGQTSGSNNPGGVTNPLATQYRDQLVQMREMGIHDEKLSILALRVSDGDVGTAVELIFSGWTGEGSDSQMAD